MGTREVLKTLAMLALVFTLSACFGGAYFFGSHGPERLHMRVIPRSFGPSLMMACGQGFTYPALAQCPPAVVDFMDYRTDRLSSENLPGELPVSPVEGYHKVHRYLLYTVGMAWRFFGISWNVLKGLLVVAFAVSMTCAYGLFRLGMNRVLSLVATLFFAASPLVLTILMSPRDFLKAPFFLGALLIMGYLVRHRVRKEVFLALAALLGFIIGLGLGFRQDVLMCLPPALCVAAFSRRPGGRRVIGQRLMAVTLLVCGFAVPALSILTSPGHVGFHQLIMGMSTQCEDDLGVERASYERVYEFSDLYAFAAPSTYGRRVNGWDGPIPYIGARIAQAEREFITANALRFPGDMLTRAYGGVFRVLRDGRVRLGTHSRPENAFMARCMDLAGPLAAHFGHFGHAYAVAALIFIAGADLWLGVAALLFLLYFTGYVNLQFEFRHCFHLGFVTLWLAGFVWYRVLWAGARCVKADGRAQVAGALRQWRAIGVRLGRFALVAFALTLVPLWAARGIQYVEMGRLVEEYASADLEAVQVERVEEGGWVQFKPAGHTPIETPQDDPWRFEASYWAVDLGPQATASDLVRICYARGGEYAGFPATLCLGRAGTPCQGGYTYFFPVYESTVSPRRCVFEGIALPAEEAGAFEGLYRVRNLDVFPLLPLLLLPDDRGAFAHYQKLRPERQVFPALADAYQRQGNAYGEADALRMALLVDPGQHELRVRLIERLCDLQRYAEAGEEIRKAEELGGALPEGLRERVGQFLPQRAGNSP